jgi:hypothetical protein
MTTERTELYGVPQEGIDDGESGRSCTVAETNRSMDPMNELYRLLQEGIDDVENGRTKSMKDSIEYIREQIN